MSRLMMSFSVLALLLCSVASAEEGKSECLESGDGIAAFYVTKVAGAEDDGVEKGEQLCYRCRYGSRPMVMVFARKTGGKVGKLVKELDAAVSANEDAELKGLLTLLGDDAEKLQARAAKVAERTGAKKIPVVVAKDNVTGPSAYKINEKAAVTVVVAKDSKVVGSHQFDEAEQVDVAAVMKQVKSMLN